MFAASCAAYPLARDRFASEPSRARCAASNSREIFREDRVESSELGVDTVGVLPRAQAGRTRPGQDRITLHLSIAGTGEEGERSRTAALYEGLGSK